MSSRAFPRVAASFLALVALAHAWRAIQETSAPDRNDPDACLDLLAGRRRDRRAQRLGFPHSKLRGRCETDPDCAARSPVLQRPDSNQLFLPASDPSGGNFHGEGQHEP